MTFNCDFWLEEKRYELADKIFVECFNIKHFINNFNIQINYDYLQSDELINKINNYRPALRLLFGTTCIRSSLDYHFTNDKKPALNLIKQILNHFNRVLSMHKKYYMILNGRKIYQTYYYISSIDTDKCEMH